MALTWNIEKVKDWKQVQEEGHAVTDMLVWATMAVGIREITESNYEEFYARLHLAELLRGTYLWDGKGARFITKEEVRERIGLTTNASNFSRTEFHKRVLNNYYKDHIKEDK